MVIFSLNVQSDPKVVVVNNIRNTAAASEIWTIGKTKIAFQTIKYQGKNVLIEKKCAISKKCRSFNVLQEKIKFPKRLQVHGGASPHSLFCRKVLSAKIVVLADRFGHQNSFCLFKDRSLVDAYSLYQFFKR